MIIKFAPSNNPAPKPHKKISDGYPPYAKIIQLFKFKQIKLKKSLITINFNCKYVVFEEFKCCKSSS